MEDQRSLRSGDFYVREDEARAAPISKTAVASVALLVIVVGWLAFSHSGTQYVRSASPRGEMAAAASDADAALELSAIAASANMEMATSDIAMIGPSVVGELVAQYQNLKESNSYTPENANAIAQRLGENINVQVPYKKYTVSEIKTINDTSYEAMLEYRGQLKIALSSIASLKEYELGIFAKYSETKDQAYLDQLRTIVRDYAATIKAAADVSTPSDAGALHANILNAMGEFNVVLEGLADNASDPITVMTLLRSYNDAESSMITSFNNLAMYFAHHPKP